MISAIRYLIFAFCFYCLIPKAEAQKHDYTWLSGYEGYPNPGFFAPDSTHYATSVLNFNHEPVRVSMDSLQMYFDKTNTSYCDTNGNLLFYSNGIYVANSLDQRIDNSDSMNAGWMQYVYAPQQQTDGFRTPQGIVALEDPANPDRYYLIHSFPDRKFGSPSTSVFYPKVLVTYLDMSANAGHGRVIYKNETLINDDIDGLGHPLTAIRHANGRDWWLLVKKQNSNCFYRVLLDPSGVHVLPDMTCGIFHTVSGEVGRACFSPDGSKYVYLNGGAHPF